MNLFRGEDINLLDLAGLGQGRDADLHPHLDAQIGLGAAAIDADITLAAELLDQALADMRETALEPAIQPCAVLALVDRH